MRNQPTTEPDLTSSGPRRSVRSAASALTGALAYERVRLTRSLFTWMLLGVAIVVSTGGAWLSVTAGISTKLDLAGGKSVAAVSTGFALIPHLAALSGLASISGDGGTAVARSLFMWVPSRWPVLVAKIALQVAVAVALSAGAVAGALTGLALGTSAAPETSAEALRVVLGGVPAAVLLALLGLGIGAIARRAIDGYLMLFGLILVLPVIAGGFGLGSPGLASVARLLPMAAANAMFDPLQNSMTASAWSDVATLTVWAAGALIIGSFALYRRDIT
ncbi:hypothetical protein SAMN05443377_10385 [Propionibacterium cyclohexanicum]|uniref:ABC-2 type transport system permease protein n=1 Tax=Propionibacterium cyclohexanicum TaxID=64702 RepID=A0A1H9QFP3_9ACTN|nr:hypothetical protein [Propionibacterium cyclohexanicum]SER59294.1 hypothetical protein SAMN05443377_10385 [Propionibacterium cyclohexanicum]